MELLDVLRLVAPGTKLRAAIEEMMRAKIGALIVVYKDGLEEIMEGGFKIDCPFTQQKLIELCKMDGAVILSENMEKILYANSLLVPNPVLPSRETGTKHKAAERTARQLGTLAIAISERKRTTTLYYGNIRYVLRPTEELLRKATEALDILEKQRQIFDELLNDLDILELGGMATLDEACSAIQRAEIISRISSFITRYIVELGKEGLITKMRFNELVRGIEQEKALIIKDYAQGDEGEALKNISRLSFEELLEISNIKRCLASSDRVFSRGHRMLSRLNISEQEIEQLIKKFQNLGNLLKANETDIKEQLSRLREKAIRRKL